MNKKEYQKQKLKVLQIEPTTILAGTDGVVSNDRDKRGELYDEIEFSGEYCDDPE